MTAICCYNGEWRFGFWAGIALRNMANGPYDLFSTVASSNERKYYTDQHLVDEDLMTAPIHGGYKHDDAHVGVMCRNMWNAHTGTFIWVASKCKNKKYPTTPD